MTFIIITIFLRQFKKRYPVHTNRFVFRYDIFSYIEIDCNKSIQKTIEPLFVVGHILYLVEFEYRIPQGQ